MKVAVLGAGAWGTAMSACLSEKEHEVWLLPRRPEHAIQIERAHENEYLPGIDLSNVKIGHSPGDIKGAAIVLFACPSSALLETAKKVQPYVCDAVLIALCKGLNAQTLQRPSEVLQSIFRNPIGMLTGPNAASEVAEGKPSASVLACTGLANERFTGVQEALSTKTFRVYRSDDLKGVEWGSCLKNVYAIGAGICQGLQLGDNAKSAYLTRALHEMVRFGVSFGGQPSTFYGLSGFGDLIATSHGSWSRNRTFGELLGKGSSIASLLENRKTVVEGYAATVAFFKLCQSKIDMPLLQELYAVLYEHKDPKAAILALMNRSLKVESAL
ncbi:MAG: hypothetical protein A2Y14_01995 [Verrucomicrobia bacterium GWF2_51_19]|nr:MAG: hypothetical protein A2Y14_01995 [Verrucomicrobia bacterium GWF2_51_19]HCJ11759.1 glycerol-3-phosphate dehydrogenase [Opitutae bacterium]